MFDKVAITEIVLAYFSLGMPLLVLFLSYYMIKLAIKNGVQQFKNQKKFCFDFLMNEVDFTPIKKNRKIILSILFLFMVFAITTSFLEATFAIITPAVILAIIYSLIKFVVFSLLKELEKENIINL